MIFLTGGLFLIILIIIGLVSAAVIGGSNSNEDKHDDTMIKPTKHNKNN